MSWYGPLGQQLYYEDAGQGDAVVVLPGWGGSVVDLNRLRGELVGGFRVIAVDLPGSGRSQPQPRLYPSTYYLDDAQLLLGLLDELRVEVAHLVGFSDGGEEALLMAAVQPARALSVLTWGAAGQIEASPRLLRGLAHLLDDPVDELKPLAAYLAENYGVDEARIMANSWAEALTAVIDVGGDISRSRAARITCPALLIAGTHDPFCRRPWSNRWPTPFRAGRTWKRKVGMTSTCRTAAGWPPRSSTGSLIISGPRGGRPAPRSAGRR